MGFLLIFSIIGSSMYTIFLLLTLAFNKNKIKTIKYHTNYYITLIMVFTIYPILYEIESPTISKTTVTVIPTSQIKEYLVIGGSKNKVNLSFSDESSTYIHKTINRNKYRALAVIATDDNYYCISDDSLFIDSISNLNGFTDTTFELKNTRVIWENIFAGKKHSMFLSTKIFILYLIIMLILNSKVIYLTIIKSVRKYLYSNRDRGMYKDVMFSDYFDVPEHELYDFCTFNIKRDLSVAKTSIEHKMEKMKL